MTHHSSYVLFGPDLRSFPCSDMSLEKTFGMIGNMGFRTQFFIDLIGKNKTLDDSTAERDQHVVGTLERLCRGS